MITEPNSNSQNGQEVQQQWSEIRLIAAFRWLLATTALTIIYLDPREPDNQTWKFTYLVLAAYVVYASLLYWLAIRHTLLKTRVEWWTHWIDVAWFTLLIGMSGGTNRIFFFGFLFAILVASFRRGFKAGISVVIVSTLSITIIGYVKETASPGFEGYGFDVYRFMLRPIFLIVLGYLMAHWGESELELKRRLAMLKDITLSNPRFGADRTIASILNRLREFFHADLALLLTIDQRRDRCIIYRSASSVPAALPHPEELAPELFEDLLRQPESLQICFASRQPMFGRANDPIAFNGAGAATAEPNRKVAARLADILDAESFISIPIMRHQAVTGRVYVSASNARRFRRTDLEFLASVIEHTNPIIDNIRLVDTLASDAAEQERQRIARDIHDSIIQPYIGFQIALSGLRRKLEAGQTNLNAEIQQLTEMTSMGVGDLRRYVSQLKNPEGVEATLTTSLTRFADRFKNATGISVKVEVPPNLQVKDNLAAEVFQMAAEGLSNIRRHTQAAEANVRIRCDESHLVLTITNNEAHEPAASFTPRSISERAASLNGRAFVEQTESQTKVSIEIPL